MKLRNVAVALSVATVWPPFANAGDNMDAIRASFDRDLNREVPVRHVPLAGGKNDPLDLVNVALRSGPDPVRASFERDLYREPVAFSIRPSGKEADPLKAINASIAVSLSVAGF